MDWQVFTDSEPISRKEYYCDAYRYFLSNMAERDFNGDDLLIYQAAKADKFKIKKGTKYFKRTGLFDGMWQTFRARIDMHNLCIKHELYEEY